VSQTIEDVPAGANTIEEEVVRRLEAVIDLLRGEKVGGPGPDCGALTSGPANQMITAAAKAMYRARRKRQRHFAMLERDFGEPVWDVMLDLFIAGREKRRVSVSSACIAADVPPTTALRWIQHMEEQAVVVREPDPTDRRRTYLRLSEPIAAAMECYITELLPGEGAG
jgi:DNA-binding MarR family transcriptional regulator